MNTPKTHTISTIDWELIETIYWQDWFTFYSDQDFQFSKSDNPNIDEIINITAWQEFWFDMPTSFWVKWNIWSKIFITCFNL